MSARRFPIPRRPQWVVSSALRAGKWVLTASDGAEALARVASHFKEAASLFAVEAF